MPLDAPLARVNGSENLVTVRGHFGGETSFGGRGAGGDPTAVAVVSDVLGIARGARPPMRPTLTVVDDTLFFSASDGSGDSQLWMLTPGDNVSLVNDFGAVAQ